MCATCMKCVTHTGGSAVPDMQPVLKWLEGSYWQGIAGLAQIVAVVFAVVAAWQSRDAAKQAATTVEQGRKLIAETMALVTIPFK